MNAFSLQPAAMQRCLPHPPIQYSARTTPPTHNQFNKARKGNKRQIDQKERNEMVPICRRHASLQRKSQQEEKKILEQISELHKVTGHKINIKKQSYFFTLTMSM